jgi:hypothetical protein
MSEALFCGGSYAFFAKTNWANFTGQAYLAKTNEPFSTGPAAKTRRDRDKGREVNGRFRQSQTTYHIYEDVFGTQLNVIATL